MATQANAGGPPSEAAQVRGELLRFAPINGLRWQLGKAQRSWRFDWWVGVAVHLVLMVACMAVALWFLHKMGKDLNPQVLWQKARQVDLAPQMLLFALAWLLQPVARQAMQTRELRLSAHTLELRYAWPWLNRWLGWQLPLHELNPAPLQVQRTRISRDPLSQLTLMRPFSRVGHALTLADWAPLRSGKVVPGTWPAASQLPSHRDVFFSREPDAAQLADLQARVLQLPLGQALAARGVPLQVRPGPLTVGGQLDLARVPELRRGMYVLALLAVLALLLMVATQHWHFFRAPIGLFAALALASAAVLAWLLWPKGDLHALTDEPAPEAGRQMRRPGQRAGRGRAPSLGLAANARREGHAAALFMAAIGGGLCGWVLLCGLVLLLARGPMASSLTTQAFTLDLGHMPMGPIVLKAQGAGVPDIHTDSRARFWQSQTQGQRYDLPVGRMGPMWVYDARPLQPAMQAFYGR